MVEVKLDAEHALLTIAYAGHVGIEQVRQYRADVKAAAEKLTPGFRLLTDLSRLESMDYNCAREIEAMMDLFRKKGVGLVVRVVPDSKKDIGFKVMSLFHYGREVPVLTFDSPAEAQAKLLEM